MSPVGDVLVRRGAEVLYSRLQHHDGSHLPHWLRVSIYVLTIVTGVVFIVAFLFVDYTCLEVAATLAAVEDSSPNTYIRLEDQAPDNSLNANDPEDPVPSNTKPITTGLRSTLKYLRSRGGFWSCFRGYRMYLACTGGGTLMSVILTFTTGLPLTPSLQYSFWQFFSTMFFATSRMAWIHQVVADKSPRRGYRRMLGYHNWPRIAPAAALYSILMSVSNALPLGSIQFSSQFIPLVGGQVATKTQIPIILLVGILSTILSILIYMPANAIFARVATSMLPEEDDPIVPFDRAFGGKVKSEYTGGSGRLGLKDAWTTFERAARTRYGKIILKASGIAIAICVIGTLLVLGEMAINH